MRRNVHKQSANRWNAQNKGGISCHPYHRPFAAAPSTTRKSGYVIGGGETPITQSTYDRAMERIGKTINMHDATAHVFRHSYLTFLGTLNTNVKTIQAIAGHSDI